MQIEVDGTSREVAALIRDLAKHPPIEVGKQGIASALKITQIPDDEPKFPTVADIQAFISSLPRRQHSLDDLMSHFFTKVLPARRPDGSSNPTYLKFVHRVKLARQALEAGGKKFQVSKQGRKVIYALP